MKHTTWLTNEGIEQAEFAASELERLAVGHCLMAASVDSHSQAAGHFFGSGLATATSAECLHTLEQHFHAERLGDIVVGTERKANQFVGFFRFGSEHDDQQITHR